MNKLYKNLQELLEQKIGLYEKYIQLLNEEWKCVTDYSYDGLQEIIAKKRKEVTTQAHDLRNELKSRMRKRTKIMEVPLDTMFKEEFFETKKIIYFPV